MRIYFQALNSILFIYVYILCQNHIVLIAVVFRVLKSGSVSLQTMFFKIVLATLNFLNFHMNFRISLSIYRKKISWNFVWNCIESENISEDDRTWEIPNSGKWTRGSGKGCGWGVGGDWVTGTEGGHLVGWALGVMLYVGKLNSNKKRKKKKCQWNFSEK